MDLSDDRSNQLQELLDISKEVILLDEIKDIRDELSIIDFVFDQQIRAVSDMVRILVQSAVFLRDDNDVNNDPTGLAQQERVLRTSPLTPPVTQIDGREPYPRPRYSFDSLLGVLKQNKETIKQINERALRVYNNVSSSDVSAF